MSLTYIQFAIEAYHVMLSNFSLFSKYRNAKKKSAQNTKPCCN